MIGDSSVRFERLEIERGFGERDGVGEVAGREDLCDRDWVVVVVVGGTVEDLKGESREGRRAGEVGGEGESKGLGLGFGIGIGGFLGLRLGLDFLEEIGE